MPLPDDSSVYNITPPAKSLDLERPNRPYIHRPDSIKPVGRRYTGGTNPHSPIYQLSSTSSLPGQESPIQSVGGTTIAGTRRYTASSSSNSLPLRKQSIDSSITIASRNSIDSNRLRASRESVDNAYNGIRESAIDSNVSIDSASSLPRGSLSDVDLSIVKQHNEDEDFDEDNEILEFKLNNEYESGIIRNRESTEEEGAPQLIRYSASSSTRDTLSPTESKHQHKHSKGEMFQQTFDPQQLPEQDDTLPSEFSHQSGLKNAFVDNNSSQEKEDLSDDEGEWQDMKTVGSYAIYDDKGQVIVHKKSDIEGIENEADDRDDLKHASAAKGYTRVAVADDAKSINSIDENTDFLFGDDELERSPLGQLQATKDMLTDSQKIAYVGLCRLVIYNLALELGKLKQKKRSFISSNLTKSQESMAMWGQKMMIRLYAHMDIKPEEQIMIEQLAEHGVLPSDLSPSLLKSAKVKNPIAKEVVDEEKKEASEDEKKEMTSGGDLKASELNFQKPEELEDLQTIDIDIRWTVLCDLFLVLISDSIYDSRSRTLFQLVGKILGINELEIAQFECKVTDALEIEEGSMQTWDESEIMENRRKLALKKKYMYVGLATLGGGLVIGLSAGLLAPVIGAGLAAGFTTIGITGTSGFLAGAGGAAVVTTTGAAIGARIGSKGMATRMGHVKTFEFRPLHNHKRVSAIVTVSGWMLGKEDDVRLPFSTIDPIMGDILSVLWEPEMLRSMGQTINILATEVLTQSIQQVLGSTVLVALMASIQLPMVLSKLGYLLDNPWSVSLDRAWASGLILADALINRNLGVRPITLVGFSLGARVIYSCLVELARRGAYGLIQDVFIFGAPVVVKKNQFLLARSVVSGRFLNGYSRKDWVLGYLFRATSGGLGRVCGLAPIDGIETIDNFDNTEFVDGHMGYRKAIPRLLRECGWEVLSDEFTEIEDPDPDKLRERQRELIIEFDEARKQMEKEQREEKKGNKKSKFFSWMKPKKKEWWEMADKEAESSKAGGGKGDDEQQGDVMFDLEAIKKEVENLETVEGVVENGKVADVVPISNSAYNNEFEEYDAGIGDDVEMSFEAFEDDEAERNGGRGYDNRTPTSYPTSISSVPVRSKEFLSQTEVVKSVSVPVSVANSLPPSIPSTQPSSQPVSKPSTPVPMILSQPSKLSSQKSPQVSPQISPQISQPPFEPPKSPPQPSPPSSPTYSDLDDHDLPQEDIVMSFD